MVSTSLDEEYYVQIVVEVSSVSLEIRKHLYIYEYITW